MQVSPNVKHNDRCGDLVELTTFSGYFEGHYNFPCLSDLTKD